MRLIPDMVDVRGAAAAALEHEWDVRTPAERDEFTRLFAELLERGLGARLAGNVNPVNGILMTWQGETRVNDEARVATVVESRDGRKIIVVYRMTERRGRWLVRDVVVDGISTTDNYRSQFKRVLRQGSYATLVAQLRAKLGEETLMFAQASPVPKPVEEAATTRPSPAPRVVARAPAHPPAARATAPPVARAGLPSVAKAIAPSVAKTAAPSVAKTAAPSVAKAAAPSVARTAAPSVAKTAAPSVARAAAPTTAPIAAAPTPPANETRVALVAMTPVVLSPAAEVVSPLSLAAMSTDVLPSALLVVLGFAGVSGAVYLRRRAAASEQPEILHRRAHQAVVEVHEDRPVLGPQDVAPVQVAVDALRARRRQRSRHRVGDLQRDVAIAGRERAGDELPGEQHVERLPDGAFDGEPRPVRRGAGGADRVQPSDRAPDAAPVLGVQLVERAPAHLREPGVEDAVDLVQRRAGAQVHGRDRGDFRRGELGQEAVLVLDRRPRPASRP